MKIRWQLAIWAALVVAGAARVAAQDSINAARDLYAAAAYEDALSVLERLRAQAQAGPDSRLIDQYRAFCLLALNRSADAQQAIEAVVAAQPLYQPSEDEVSPRVRNAFTDVRRRVLPVIVQRNYAIAKAAYDRKDYVEAANGFKQVLTVLADPDVVNAAAMPPLADIRTLATGFHELAAAAAAPPPPPPAPEPPPPAPVAAAPPSPPRIYSAEDGDVVPPSVIRQNLPAFPLQSLQMAQIGIIEVVINEVGRVEQASLREPVHPAYDRLALGAARTWQYTPATLNGVPVKYKKIVQITVRR
jgi:TonB family protein